MKLTNVVGSTRITYPSARCALVTSNELHTPVGVDGTASN